MSAKININISVADKIASAIGAPTIVCGNSNYQITFTLDSEWETSNAKTARFVYRRDGKIKFKDVAFSGRVVGVPTLSNIDEVYVGLYAGDIYTSTPARIICKKSILCGTQTQEEPDPDVYRQILQTINDLETLPTMNSADAGRTLTVNEAGRWVARWPDYIYDQNSGALIRVFIGTKDAFLAWTGDKRNVLFVQTDNKTIPNLIAELQQLKDDLDSGGFVVAKAKYAEKAANADRANVALYADTDESKGTIEKRLQALWTMLMSLNPVTEFTKTIDYSCGSGTRDEQTAATLQTPDISGDIPFGSTTDWVMTKATVNTGFAVVDIVHSGTAIQLYTGNGNSTSGTVTITYQYKNT